MYKIYSERKETGVSLVRKVEGSWVWGEQESPRKL